MASGNKVGSIFVELDLETSSYTRKQREILAGAKTTSLDIEKNWRTIGATSDKMYDAMKANISNAYQSIANNAKSSTQEITRAHEAMNTKIQQLNQQQLGIHQTTNKSILDQASSWGIFASKAYIAYQAVHAITAVFSAGFKAVEDYQMSVASIASSMASFSKLGKTDMAGAYKEAYTYASALVPKLEEWDAKTVATGKNLTAMAETMIQSGVQIDINNKKHEAGFIAIANALALTTKGQNADIQFRQEIRGLMDGEVKATNKLATMLNNVMGGALKENIEKWREEGTVIENIGALLTGFAEGAKDFENTWTAIGSTIETITNKLLRDTFRPVYEDIIRLSKEFTVEAVKSGGELDGIKETLQTGVYKSWEAIKGAAEGVWNLVSTLGEPMKIWLWYTAQVLDKLGMGLVILPIITERVWHIAEAWKNVIMTVGNYASALYYLVTGQMDKARQAVVDAKSRWTTAGAHVGEAFDTGLGAQITSALAKYNDKVKKFGENVKAPELMPGGKGSDKAAAAAQKAAEASAERMRKATEDLDVMIGQVDGKVEGELAKIEKRYADMAVRLKGNAEALMKLEEWRATATLQAYTKVGQAAEEKAVKEIEAEVNAGVKITEAHLKGGEEYRKLKAGEYDFAATENERQINAIIAKEEEKLYKLEDLYRRGYITFAEYEGLKAKIAGNTTAAILEKTTENALKIAKINEDLIKNVRGWEGDAYNARIAEIDAQAASYIKDGANFANVQAWKSEQAKKAYREMALASDDWVAGVMVGLQDLADSQKTWAEASSEMTKKLFSEMEGFASDLFFKAITGDLDDIDEMFEKTWKSLLKSFVDMIAEMVVKWLALKALMALGLDASFTGSGGGGGGGSGGGASGIAGGIAKMAAEKGIKAAYTYYFGGGATAASTVALQTSLGAGPGSGAFVVGAQTSVPLAANTGPAVGAVATPAATPAASAGAGSMLATIAPYVYVAGAAWVVYNIIKGVASMGEQLKEKAMSHVASDFTTLGAMSGQGELGTQYAGGRTLYGEMHTGASGEDLTKAINIFSPDQDKIDFALELIRNMEDYGKAAKLTEEEISALIEQGLGPMDKEFKESVITSKHVYDALEAIGTMAAGTTEVTDAYTEAMKLVSAEISAADDPIKTLTAAVQTHSAYTMESAASIRFLSDAMGLSAKQTAYMTEVMDAASQGMGDSDTVIQALAETLAISAEAAGDLARALNLIPNDINVNFTATGEAPLNEGSAAGGFIRGGSGYRDDVFLGMTPGVAHWGMGGEFIVNKKSASRYGRLLNFINASHAAGGPITPEELALQQRAMEIEFQGTTPAWSQNARNMSRSDELTALDPSLRALKENIWIMELVDQRELKHLELMKLSGNAAGALAKERRRELDAMEPGLRWIQQQIYAQEDYNAALEETQKAQEEAAANAARISGQRRGMEISLLDAQGDAVAALSARREDELKALDPSLVALQKQIYAAQDAAKAQNELTQAQTNAASKLEAALGKIKAEDFATSYAFRKAVGLTKIRGYDSGGFHPGGPLVVGESGPELMFTGPSRIFSNKESRGMLGGDLVGEVRALREDLVQLGIQTTVNTGKTAKILDKFDGEGMPETRDSDAVTWG